MRSNFISNIPPFLKEVFLEGKRVNWPTSKQIVQNTLLVLAITLIVALFLGSIDFLLTTLLERFVL